MEKQFHFLLKSIFKDHFSFVISKKKNTIHTYTNRASDFREVSYIQIVLNVLDNSKHILQSISESEET